jgi:hypothetical protein
MIVTCLETDFKPFVCAIILKTKFLGVLISMEMSKGATVGIVTPVIVGLTKYLLTVQLEKMAGALTVKSGAISV